MQIEKSFWRSRRFWFNAITVALGLAGHFADAGILSAGTMAIVNPVGNLILNQVSDGAKLTL